LLVLLDAFEVVEGRPASREQVERCHSPAYLDRLEALEVPTMLDPDTVASETSYEAALLAAGCTLRLAQQAPEAGYGAFTYVQPPSGLLVELVWSAIKPMFDRWFAGGPLG